MREITIQPSRLSGSVTVPQSKSHCHRLLIAAALAGRKPEVMQRITPESKSEDIIATSKALDAIFSEEAPTVDCRESGSTLRFLLPITMACKDSADFFGKGRLPNRPLSPLWEQMEEHGVRLEHKEGSHICHAKGRMQGGDFFLPGNVSSQYVTGLLYALPMTEDGGCIHMTSPLESHGYVDLTLHVLEEFGIRIDIEKQEDGCEHFFVAGKQTWTPPENLTPEGDWSGAAFWEVATAIGSDVTCLGLRNDSAQGDKEIASLISDAPKSLENVDASDIPDLVPVLSVLMALTPGEHRISNAERLRIKESDRLATTAAGLSALGATISETEDGLSIVGKESLTGGTVDGAGDHRIVMAMAIAATRCEKPVTIVGAEAVAKSYPTFFEEYERLGGKL